MNFDLFTSPTTYISGMTALSIPDEGRWGGDWHFMDALCLPSSRIHSSGEKGNMSNTNKFLGSWLITNKSAILSERGITCHKSVFCASHTRAITDLIFHSVSRNIYPAHVITEGIIEEKAECEEIDKMLRLMAPNLSDEQNLYITKWKNEILEPSKNGMLQ